MIYGDPLPLPTPEESARERAIIDATPWGLQHAKARARRWRKFVTARGCPPAQGFARDAFLRDNGLVTLFDLAEEEARR